MSEAGGKDAEIGIVHFGPGAFHRAHQADYIARIQEGDPRWGIAAVSLRSGGTVEALRQQQGRYTLEILDADTEFRPIDAHRAFVGPGEGDRLCRLLASPAVRIVTTTVTEKGYCLRPDGGLDARHPDIVHDLERPAAPVSIIGWIVLGLRLRRESGLAPFTTICCDNMVANGGTLKGAVLAFAAQLDPELAGWIDNEAVFPNTMVDSITPATDDRLRALVTSQTGFEDAIPVSREAYSAWIIEDCLPEGLPDFAAAGAVMASDVGAWERAKLRILNGTHSTLAYLGLLIGHETVADTMADPMLAAFAERLIREDIVPTLRPSPIDLDAYAAEILQRFRNPAIHHRLSQIAWDGSQKLPYRILDTMGDALAANGSISRLATSVAAWIAFIIRQACADIAIVDPLASSLADLGRSEDAAQNLLSMSGIFPERLRASPRFNDEVLSALESIRGRGAASHLQACLP